MVMSKTFLDFRRKQENIIMFLFWSITWVIIIYFSLFPEKVESTMSVIGMQKAGMGTFLGLSIIFVFFIMYRIYNKANRVENKLRELVTKLGLKDLDQ